MCSIIVYLFIQNDYKFVSKEALIFRIDEHAWKNSFGLKLNCFFLRPCRMFSNVVEKMSSKSKPSHIKHHIENNVKIQQQTVFSVSRIV